MQSLSLLCLFLHILAPCINTKLGLGYMGLQDQSVFNKPCIKWTLIAKELKHEMQELSIIFPDDTIEDAANYCRRIPWFENRPLCYVDANFYQINSWESCSVPYCGENIPKQKEKEKQNLSLPIYSTLNFGQ